MADDTPVPSSLGATGLPRLTRSDGNDEEAPVLHRIVRPAEGGDGRAPCPGHLREQRAGQRAPSRQRSSTTPSESRRSPSPGPRPRCPSRGRARARTRRRPAHALRAHVLRRTGARRQPADARAPRVGARVLERHPRRGGVRRRPRLPVPHDRRLGAGRPARVRGSAAPTIPLGAAGTDPPLPRPAVEFKASSPAWTTSRAIGRHARFAFRMALLTRDQQQEFRRLVEDVSAAAPSPSRSGGAPSSSARRPCPSCSWPRRRLRHPPGRRPRHAAPVVRGAAIEGVRSLRAEVVPAQRVVVRTVHQSSSCTSTCGAATA